MITPRKLLLALSAITLGLTAALTIGCGDGDDSDDDGGVQPTVGATEPAGGEIDISGIQEIEDGVLNIGSDIAYAPVEYIDEETNEPAGLDVDIADAMAEALGIEAEFTNGSFDGLIPALQAERHDALMSSMWVNEERLAQLDMIPYFNAGGGIIVPQGNPDGITGAADLCGKTVAVQAGTAHVTFLEAQSERCTAAGNEAITINGFGTDPEAVLALLAGQADAEVADFPVAALSATERESEIDLIEGQIDPLPYGIAVRKESTALRDALQAAFDAIVEDGTYDEILQKWNLESGKLE